MNLPIKKFDKEVVLRLDPKEEIKSFLRTEIKIREGLIKYYHSISANSRLEEFQKEIIEEIERIIEWLS